jgi:hypothetical protein
VLQTIILPVDTIEEPIDAGLITSDPPEANWRAALFLWNTQNTIPMTPMRAMAVNKPTAVMRTPSTTPSPNYQGDHH